MSDQNDHTVIFGAQPAAPAPSPAAVEEGNARNALPIGTYMGEFEIISLIGVGGFGIVYLAQDHSLGRKVALKEYMPASLATRGEGGLVSVRSARHQETFEAGRRSFVNEARLLAQFDHPALVKVHRFWEANGTAFMVMPFYEGRTLKQVLAEQPGPFDEVAIKRVLDPVTEALSIIHAEDCLHRDIAPDNIMLLADGRPVLLDFGAARRVINDSSQALTVILKPGYAPVEQYAEMPGVRQGPWTDVYALAAVVYFAITRRVPPPSVARMMQGGAAILPTDASNRYSAGFLAAVEKCMAVRAEDRPQTMAEMRALFGLNGHATAPVNTYAQPAVGVSGSSIAKSAAAGAPREAGSKRLPLIVGTGAVVLALAGGAAYTLLGKSVPTAETVVSTPVDVLPAAPLPSPQQGVGSLDETFKGVVVRADNAINVALSAASPVTVGSGTLKLSLSSNITGYLYLLLWDKGEDKVYCLFPNKGDPENHFQAGATFKVPREDVSIPWEYTAEAPVGEWRVLAVVSESPRDFSKSGLRSTDGVLAGGRAEIESALAGGAGISTLIGTVACKPGEPCSERFGASMAVVTEVEALAGKAPGK